MMSRIVDSETFKDGTIKLQIDINQKKQEIRNIIQYEVEECEYGSYDLISDGYLT